MKKRLWAVLLAVCMAITMVPMTALAAENAPDIKTVSTADELREVLTDVNNTNITVTVDCNIKLPSNITISGDRKIVLQGATNDVTITLNGSVDSMTTDAERSMFYLAEGSNISMTIQNITLDGGNVARLFLLGNGVDDSQNSLTIENGSVLKNGYPQLPQGVSGNQPAGGAIRLGNNSKVIMNGGKITDNKSNRYGGGIYGWASDAVVEINGGEISGNSGRYAGGIVMLGSSTLYLNGGKIVDNVGTTGHGGGIFFQDGTIHLGGNATVQNNTLSGTTAADLYFNNNNVKVYVDSALTGKVTFKPGKTLPNIIAADDYEISASDAAHLSLSTGDGVFYLDSQSNAIKYAASSKTITFAPNNSSTDSDSYTQRVPNDIQIPLNPNTFTYPGYTFTGWNTAADGTGTAYADGQEVTLNDNLTLYAQWCERQLSSIEVTAKNPSVPYGTVLSTADLTVTAIYDNGEHEEVTAGYTIAPSTELKTLGENTVTVTYQSKTAACNITVAKAAQSAPAAPTLKTSDYTGITLNTVEANANGATAQYRCNDGAWQDSPEFTGLTAGTVYTFAVRYGETDTYAASEAGDTAEFSTLRYFPGSSGSSTGSPVTVSSAKNGDVTVSPKTAKKGDTVTITVTPDKGYTLETLTVLDKNGSELTLTDKGDGKYTFTMPDGKVEVRATFMDDNTMLNHFVDVQAGDYFYDAVLWAVKNGITKGVSDTDFGPDLACTRAQIVTFLWRAAGSPEPKSVSSFADVSADSYYAKAVAWAVENGITGGTGDGQFSPDATCTREQAVAFLYRASGSPAVSGGSAFGDVAADAYYASAVTWAEKNGVTGGIGGGLFGSGNDCTRAQIVTFLYRAYQGK